MPQRRSATALIASPLNSRTYPSSSRKYEPLPPSRPILYSLLEQRYTKPLNPSSWAVGSYETTTRYSSRVSAQKNDDSSSYAAGMSPKPDHQKSPNSSTDIH